MPTKIRGQIKRRIEALTAERTPPGSKKLQGVMDREYPVYRVRQGDYRILYSVRPIIIVILDIGHRKDVYRMTAAKPTPNDLRMNGEESDRIMQKALHVRPEKVPKVKRRASPKAPGEKAEQASNIERGRHPMDTQEYLGIISILKQARDSVNAVVDDLSDRSTAASDLRRVVADLERATAAYQDKLKASRT